MAFCITELGFYQQRNGKKAEVVVSSRGIWFGFDSEGFVASWNSGGTWNPIGGDKNEHVLDVVAIWTEPSKFSVGDRVRVKSRTEFEGQCGEVVGFHGPRPRIILDGMSSPLMYGENELEPENPPIAPDGFVIQPSDYVDRSGDMACDRNGIWCPAIARISAADRARLWPLTAPFYVASPIPKSDQWVPQKRIRMEVAMKQLWTCGDQEHWRPVELPSDVNVTAEIE